MDCFRCFGSEEEFYYVYFVASEVRNVTDWLQKQSRNCEKWFIMSLFPALSTAHMFPSQEKDNQKLSEQCESSGGGSVVQGFRLVHMTVELPRCVRYIVVFVPNVDWPIMADCVPWGKHSLRVVSERPNYASAFNVPVGSPASATPPKFSCSLQRLTCGGSVISQRIVWKSLLECWRSCSVAPLPRAVAAVMRSFQVGLDLDLCPPPTTTHHPPRAVSALTPQHPQTCSPSTSISPHHKHTMNYT